MNFTAEINDWNETYHAQGLEKTLHLVLEKYGKGVCFSTSMGVEDQALLELLCKTQKPFRVITLDTGRLFYETYELIEKTEQKYNCKIEVLFPKPESVEDMVSKNGVNLFYKSVENRKECCAIRKLEPLSRALGGAKIWMTGLRREQSPTRNEMQFAEYDEKYSLIKLNPLIDWSLEKVWEYVRKEKIPYNPLHDQDFPSIGCAPCTRAILPGEDIRAGRWWWENPETKECGLHVSDGVLIRKNK
jgi:phosphoadenosine phosphosulfate reductase